MSQSAATVAFAVELFSGMGPVETRRMFGVVALYARGVIFGLVDDDVIFVKVDEPLKADLAALGARAWVYTHGKTPKARGADDAGYWSLPDAALDDPDEACAWGLRALAVAEAAKAAKAAKPARKPRTGRA